MLQYQALNKMGSRWVTGLDWAEGRCQEGQLHRRVQRIRCGTAGAAVFALSRQYLPLGIPTATWNSLLLSQVYSPRQERTLTGFQNRTHCHCLRSCPTQGVSSCVYSLLFFLKKLFSQNPQIQSGIKKKGNENMHKMLREIKCRSKSLMLK